MIRHIVLTRFAPETTPDEIADIYAALANLTHSLPGASGFTGGRSASPEALERGYHHGFVIDFDSWADLATYAADPRHLALGQRLVAAAMGGIEGLLVLDIEV
jgi:hypothetical protein